MKLSMIMLISLTLSAFSQVGKLPTGEYTIPHTYDGQPCGTLMTDHVGPGSVHLGRGPVYHKALAVCGDIDHAKVPDDYSVRTVKCVAERSGAHALFAFRCTTPEEGDMYWR